NTFLNKISKCDNNIMAAGQRSSTYAIDQEDNSQWRFANDLQVSPMQVNVQFLQQLQPEWSRFVTVVKQREEIDKVSYHRLFDILKQFQNEVNVSVLSD
ncbi:hypothetical protein Tco_0864572, partial [Tanacetum coccineum]